MFLIRPVAIEDLPQVAHLAASAGPALSLPKESDSLRILIQESRISFSKEVLSPGPEIYLFVCENIETGKIIGSCAVRAKTGGYIPLYLYRVVSDEPATIIRLHPHRIYDGPSELCMLYILPQHRKEGLGLPLSLSRFIFMKEFRIRFEDRVFALMRPHVGANGMAPFWDAISKPFFQVDFPTVCRLRYTDPRLIELLLPKYPIYASLLPPGVQESIGKPHPHTIPAVEILKREGFRFIPLVDAIDGGPMMEAELDKINAIQRQRREIVGKIVSKPPRSQPLLLANPKLDFRACVATAHRSQKGELSITAEVAAALQLDVGEPIVSLTIRSKNHD